MFGDCSEGNTSKKKLGGGRSQESKKSTLGEKASARNANWKAWVPPPNIREKKKFNAGGEEGRGTRKKMEGSRTPMKGSFGGFLPLRLHPPSKRRVEFGGGDTLLQRV